MQSILFSFMRQRPFRRSFVGVLLAVMLLTSACASTKTITVFPTSTPVPKTGYIAPPPCASSPAETCQFWAPGIIAVAVALDPTVAPPANLDVQTAETLTRVLGLHVEPDRTIGISANGGPLDVVTFPSGGDVFLQDSDGSGDPVILKAIDTINASVQTAKDPATGKLRGFIPVDKTTAWIVGASPDWYGMSTTSNIPLPGGGDQVHGSPDDPPVGTGATTAIATPPPASANIGAGKTIYVMDSGYTSSAPLPARIATANVEAYNSLHSVLSLLPGPGGIPEDAISAGSSWPPYEFLQQDPSTMGRSGIFPSSDFQPVNLQDHGIAIAELIHYLAPAAQIVLARVLNDYGVGDLLSFLVTLKAVEQAVGSAKGVIINLSLNFGPPVACLNDFWKAAMSGNGSDQTLAQHFVTKGCTGTTNDLIANAGRYLTIGLALDDAIQAHHFIIVAAAGNGSAGNMHAGAALPAAICGVVATGALVAPGGALATFSNDPTSACLNVNSQQRAQGGQTFYSYLSNGISAKTIGVNLCSWHFTKILPYDEAPPANQLALWSGTSFATGIVSGNLAGAGGATLPTSGPYTVTAHATPC
jgi:hypothetical protein